MRCSISLLSRVDISYKSLSGCRNVVQLNLLTSFLASFVMVVTVFLSTAAIAQGRAIGSSERNSASADPDTASRTTAIITTVIGTAGGGYGGDGGPASKAKLSDPTAVAFDSAGNMFISDSYNNRIRRVDAITNVITTIAGNGTKGYRGDGGDATKAELASPLGIAIDKSGNLFIADSGNYVVREVSASTGVISTVAGNGVYGSTGDGGIATKAELLVPTGLAFDSSSNLYISDQVLHVRKVDATTQIITTFAGATPPARGFPTWCPEETDLYGDGCPATQAFLPTPTGIAFDSSGNMYIADATFPSRVRMVSASTSIITTIAGGVDVGCAQEVDVYGDNCPAIQAPLSNFVAGLAFDPSGNLYLADSANLLVRVIDSATQIIQKAAGGGESIGDGGPAVDAGVVPFFMAFDAIGNLYIADYADNAIRKITYVTSSATSTSLSADIDPQKVDTTVTFTAYVSAASGTPTGSVVFSTDSVAAAPVSLDLSGHASYKTSALKVGKHSITAAYSGDSNYSPSSDSLTETIVTDTTSITLIPSSSSVTYGQTLSVGALLSGSPAPTGYLSYTLDGGTAHSATLSGGSATLSLGTLAAGSHALSVNYAGDSIYGSASQTLSFSVAKAVLTATATSFTRAYGMANPLLTYSYSGFVNGDTSAVVGGSATLTTTATTTSMAGTYPITFATEALIAANYTFSYVPGTLTVTGSSGSCQTIDYSKGFTAAGLTLNGGATVSHNLLQLTDGGFFEARSAFYSTAVPVKDFTTDFTFQLLFPLADGITFTIQSNDPDVVGEAGGGLGYAGIPHSIAVKLDLFNNGGEGFSSTGFYADGGYPSTPAISLYPAGIDLHSGHIFAVHIAHADDMTTGTITDTATGKSASMTVPGSIAQIVGDSAYVGFTGGTGALTAIQNILSWSYSGGAGCAAK